MSLYQVLVQFILHGSMAVRHNRGTGCTTLGVDIRSYRGSGFEVKLSKVDVRVLPFLRQQVTYLE